MQAPCPLRCPPRGPPQASLSASNNWGSLPSWSTFIFTEGLAVTSGVLLSAHRTLGRGTATRESCLAAGTGEWALDSPGSCQPGPCGPGRAPVHLGPVLSGVYSRSWGRSSAFSSGPDHTWQSKASHPTGHKDTVSLIRAKHCMQGRQGPGAVLSPLLALHLFRK